MRKAIPRRIQKGVFGRDPEAYDRARLAYPKPVYEILTERCGLHPGTAVFEIGPGTGIATRELLRLGANPIVLVERDRRLARYLRDRWGDGGGRLRVTVAPFEQVDLPSRGFDLGVAAQSFHWLPERLALRRVARLLKPGGWWAMWSNHYGDPYRPSDFHQALQPLYRAVFGRVEPDHPRARARKDRADRVRALRSVGRFDRVSRDEIRWTVSLGTRRIQRLWSSFSEIVTLPPRQRAWFVAELGKVVRDRFDGTVDLPMVTPLYTARRI